MKSIHFAVLLICLAGFAANGQAPDPVLVFPEISTSGTPDSTGTAQKGDADQIPAQAQNGYVRPNGKTRFNRYVKSMFGPVALGKTVLSAGWSTWRNSPEEWGDNWEGFGRRVASSLGKSVIKHTTQYGLDEALKYDSTFYRSKKKDFGSRVANALISPITARDKNGKRVVGIPRIAGTYTASIVAAETWYPNRYDYKDGLKSGTVSLGMNAAFNLFKEFIWKK